MRRYVAIRNFLECLNDDDLIVCSGEGISREVYEYDKKSYFYVLDSFGMALSLALGMAVSTDKKIFVLVDDADFIAGLSSAVQMTISQCKNIFCVIFNSGYYQNYESNLFSISGNVKTMKVLLYGLGFVFYVFNGHFKTKKSRENVKSILNNVVGPIAILIDVDVGLNNKLKELDFSKECIKDRICNFIND